MTRFRVALKFKTHHAHPHFPSRLRAFDRAVFGLAGSRGAFQKHHSRRIGRPVARVHSFFELEIYNGFDS